LAPVEDQSASLVQSSHCSLTPAYRSLVLVSCACAALKFFFGRIPVPNFYSLYKKNFSEKKNKQRVNISTTTFGDKKAYNRSIVDASWAEIKDQ
jgi:hypothetical protein